MKHTTQNHLPTISIRRSASVLLGILFLILINSGMANAQSSVTDQLFDKYSGQEDYTSVYITKYMFELFAKIADEKEDKEFKEATSNLEAIKILTREKDANAFYKELLNSYKNPVYKDLMLVKEGKEEIKFMINEANNKISELVMIVGGDNDSVLIVLQGDINLKQISKLSKSMKIDGMEHLGNVDQKGGDAPNK